MISFFLYSTSNFENVQYLESSRIRFHGTEKNIRIRILVLFKLILEDTSLSDISFCIHDNYYITTVKLQTEITIAETYMQINQSINKSINRYYKFKLVTNYTQKVKVDITLYQLSKIWDMWYYYNVLVRLWNNHDKHRVLVQFDLYHYNKLHIPWLLHSILHHGKLRIKEKYLVCHGTSRLKKREKKGCYNFLTKKKEF